jgi:predicted acylesterase/phospholipase RssA
VKPPRTIEIAVVLGSGGFRGPAHVGVLRRLEELRVPISSMVGCSVGSVVSAYYAAAGLPIDALVDHAFGIRLSGILAHAVTLRSRGRIGRYFGRWAEPVQRRLRMLEGLDFRNLHHGVRKIGFLIHDSARGERIFAATGREKGFTLSEAVRASSRVPVLFPPIRKEVEGIERKLVDGGLSSPTPILHAVGPPISATHVVAVDLSDHAGRSRHSELDRWRTSLGNRLIVLRPRPRGKIGRRGSPAFVEAWYQAGRLSLGPDEEARLRSWLHGLEVRPDPRARERDHDSPPPSSSGLLPPSAAIAPHLSPPGDS